jgi:hypothetical protein
MRQWVSEKVHCSAISRNSHYKTALPGFDSFGFEGRTYMFKQTLATGVGETNEQKPIMTAWLELAKI